jgi:hypothetical protein
MTWMDLRSDYAQQIDRLARYMLDFETAGRGSPNQS